MFIPTYGVILYSVVMSGSDPMISSAYWYMLPIGTFLFTLFIPLTALLLLRKSGRVKDLYLDNPSERFYPYLYTLLGYAFWIFYLTHTLRASPFLICTAIGATLALVVVMLVNNKWKISAHLTAMGGLTGAVLSSAYITGVFPISATCVLLAAALVLMYARLCLNAHTPLQVVAGLMLGLISTSVPVLIYYA